jgi:hypothetical protein
MGSGPENLALKISEVAVVVAKAVSRERAAAGGGWKAAEKWAVGGGKSSWFHHW